MRRARSFVHSTGYRPDWGVSLRWLIKLLASGDKDGIEYI